MATVSGAQTGNNNVRDRHTVILAYLKTVPGVLGGVAATVAALTGLLTMILN
ncbi:hypothetical protein GCM10029963_43830 [Micromonospora andamanensis]|uniref:hypothetical protein n=1 Tax=Micromonospora andamanensis TaxID=1287068 RepID=UPI00363ADD8C